MGLKMLLTAPQPAPEVESLTSRLKTTGSLSFILSVVVTSIRAGSKGITSTASAALIIRLVSKSGIRLRWCMTS